MSVKVLCGDARDVLKSLPDASVHMCVTSPPYYGLRDYGTGRWVIRDGSPPADGIYECEDCKIVRHISQLTSGCPECGQTMTPHDHRGAERWYTEKTAATSSAGAFSEAGPDNAERLKKGRWREKGSCACGAEYVDKQMGLEATPDEWVQGMVGVFREVRRVLRPDGTCWINCGDSYAGSGKGPSNSVQPLASQIGPFARNAGQFANGQVPTSWIPVPAGLKPKDLIGIPWMLAFALRADGWYLRADIIWSKPNPMPESVQDRVTKSHEYLFLLSKNRTYFYDANAIREAAEYGRQDHFSDWVSGTQNGDGHRSGGHGSPQRNPETGRNKRSVWTVATEAFPESHFATYPTALIEPCIKAGTSEKGCCPECGAPWIRVVERTVTGMRHVSPKDRNPDRNDGPDTTSSRLHAQYFDDVRTELGWRATCGHAGEPVQCTVLDPFAGAFTTALVAERLGRDSVMVEINPTYVEMGRKRVTGDAPMFTTIDVA